MDQCKVIVSGFDPYPDVQVNPSLQVPQALAAQGVTVSGGGHDDEDGDPLDGVHVDVTAVTLPVSFPDAWPVLNRAIGSVGPDIVIATGMRRAARGIMMERCATNLMDVSRDISEDVSGSGTVHDPQQRVPIDPDGPAAYWTRLPLNAILKDFAARSIPASLSSHPDVFVCNALLYRLLRWSAAQQRVLVGFVSLPVVTHSDHREYGLPLAAQVEACAAVILQTAHYRATVAASGMIIA